MSAVILDEGTGPAPEPPAPPTVTTPGTWHVTWHGIRTVAVLELRQRVRSTRWVVALIAWFVVVGVITALTWLATGALTSGDGISRSESFGPTIFGVVVFFVLFLGLVVAPTLSATAVNGDRSAGTLAILQVTLLSPAEIVLGKLLAAWAAALAFLAVSVPFLLLALAAGGTPVLSVLVCLVVLALILVSVCAIGIGFSALTARSAGSAVLTYLAVAGLTVVSLILFGLTFQFISDESQDVRVYTVPSSYDWEDSEPPDCVWETQPQYQSHTERTWWLLAINPFVIVSDAAPESAEDLSLSGSPLNAIRAGVRELRAGRASEYDYCWTGQEKDGEEYVSPVPERDVDKSPVWPWGLGANLLLGAAGVVTAVRRLRIPQRTLARGTRVA
jgi:ABC-type transport system involved in multi-copper enzyme maturation permease subunit